MVLELGNLDWTLPEHARILATLDFEQRFEYAEGFDQNDIAEEDESKLEAWIDGGGRFPYIRKYGSNQPAKRRLARQTES